MPQSSRSVQIAQPVNRATVRECGQANDQKDGVVETGHTIGPILISNGLANAPSPPAQRCRAPLVWIGQTARRASCCADGEGRCSKGIVYEVTGDWARVRRHVPCEYVQYSLRCMPCAHAQSPATQARLI